MWIYTMKYFSASKWWLCLTLDLKAIQINKKYFFKVSSCNSYIFFYDFLQASFRMKEQKRKNTRSSLVSSSQSNTLQIFFLFSPLKYLPCFGKRMSVPKSLMGAQQLMSIWVKKKMEWVQTLPCLYLPTVWMQMTWFPHRPVWNSKLQQKALPPPRADM